MLPAYTNDPHAGIELTNDSRLQIRGGHTPPLDNGLSALLAQDLPPQRLPWSALLNLMRG